MNLLVSHILLLTGNDLGSCTRRALNFFERSQLVRYDDVVIVKERSYPATADAFAPLLDQALQENRNKLEKLLQELQEEGFKRLIDLLDLPQGFHSNILHTIAHMEDGFFGIDAYFFDLDESSYRLSERRKLQLRQQPEKCWLLTIEASSTDSGGFERAK